MRTFVTSPRQAAGPSRSSTFVTVASKAGVLTVRPTGPCLGEREALIIAAEVRPIIERVGGAIRTLVLDLSDITQMSSFGLGMCIELRNAAKTQNATTVVFGLSNELTELFKMLKVDRLYTMARSPAELASALG